MEVTVLIVDDNAQLRALIREIVAEASNLQVVGEAADGAEAIQLVQALRPAIVLLDLIMPQVNGLEVLRWIKVEHPETKVIIVTVHDEDAYRQAAETSGGRCLSPQEDPWHRPAADNPVPVRLHVTATCIAHRRAVRLSSLAGRDGRLI
jgi:DNA-binding NarL/FixJ family response regulator